MNNPSNPSQTLRSLLSSKSGFPPFRSGTRQGAGHVFLHLHAHCPLSVFSPHSHTRQEIGLPYFPSLPPSLLTLDVSSGGLSLSASSWGSDVPYTPSPCALSPPIPFFTVGCNYQCRCLNLWTRQLAFGLLSIHFLSPWPFSFLGNHHPSSLFGVDAAVCL